MASSCQDDLALILCGEDNDDLSGLGLDKSPSGSLDQKTSLDKKRTIRLNGIRSTTFSSFELPPLSTPRIRSKPKHPQQQCNVKNLPKFAKSTILVHQRQQQQQHRQRSHYRSRQTTGLPQDNFQRNVGHIAGHNVGIIRQNKVKFIFFCFYSP